MSDSPVCCRELPAFPEAKSPFSKLIALGWYDGPTSGVLECDICSTAYRFEMLDQDPDWDEGLDIRIFSLSPLPTGAFAELVEVCEEFFGSPDWPIWVLIWDFGSEAEKNQAAQKIHQIQNRAMNPQLIVATRSLSKELIAARRVDWFALLGLSRRADYKD